MISNYCEMGKNPDNHLFCRGFIPMRGKVYPCRCECHSAARGDGAE